MINIYKIFKNRFERRIASKVSWVVLFVTVLLLAAIKFYFISNQTSMIGEMHYNLGLEMVQNYARASAEHLFREDIVALDANVLMLQGNKDILYAKVLNNNGITLTLATNVFDQKRKDYITLSEDIVYHDEHIGKLEIGLDMTGINRKLKEYSYAMFMASGSIIILLAIAIFAVMNAIIVKPLSVINASVSRIAEGYLYQEVPVNSKDELGNFAKNFNYMLKQVRDNTALTSSIIESSPSLWLAVDEEMKVLQYNSQIVDYIEYDPNAVGYVPISKEMKGENLYSLVPAFERYRHAIQNVMQTNKSIRLHREKMTDGKFIQAFIFPLKNSSFKGVVLRIDDVTEEESKDEQLRQALKLESLGTLASGLAHDFNNVLSGIVSTVSILKYRLQSKTNLTFEKLENLVDLIETSAGRAGDMVQAMLNLSRRQEMKFAPIDLNTCITHVVKMCKNTIDKSVKIETSFYPDKAIAIADQMQIDTVILNLAINGWHAMTLMRPDNPGGTLKLTLDLVTTDKFLTKQAPELYSNKFWVIGVSDNGVGISQENLKKIFDPFFTTKEKKGTGLGLTMVSNIINQHNGFIDVYSEVGIGTRFLIYIPQVSPNEAILHQIKEETILKGNGETILVVDDELIMRETASNILNEANYSVIIAEDGKQAIDIYAKRYPEIALVLIDMSMPGISGQDTFIELKKINPNIKGILCSGFQLSDHAASIKNIGIINFIEKPYTLSKLSQIVKEAIT